MKKNYASNFEYADFAPMFKAEFFDSDVWAELLAKSGARYDGENNYISPRVYFMPGVPNRTVL